MSVKPAPFQLFPDRLPAYRAGRLSRRIELNPVRDPYARAALEAYADACEAERPDLSARLRAARYDTVARLSQCAPTVLRVFGLAQAAAAARPDYAHAAWEHVRQHLALVLEGPLDPDPEPDMPASPDEAAAAVVNNIEDAAPRNAPNWLASGLPDRRGS